MPLEENQVSSLIKICNLYLTAIRHAPLTCFNVAIYYLLRGKTFHYFARWATIHFEKAQKNAQVVYAGMRNSVEFCFTNLSMLLV